MKLLSLFQFYASINVLLLLLEDSKLAG